MRHYKRHRQECLCYILSGVSLLYAQAQPPVITPNSVVNAASRIPPGLPNYGIAKGSMFSVRGQNLAVRMPQFATASSPLPLTLAGSSMQIAIAGAKIDVPMVYAGTNGDDQLAGIVPSSTPTGDGTITVTLNGRTSDPAPITIVPNAFGIFTLNQFGAGPGVFTPPDLAVSAAMAQRLVGPFFPDTNFGGNSLVAAAHPGDQLVLWGTGLGATLDAPVEVYVGNIKADVTSQARADCCNGIDQIQFTVPPGEQGCYVPVAVKIGAMVSNFATVSISPDGSVCSDPTSWSVSDLQNGAPMTSADVSLGRVMANFSVPGVGTAQGAIDFATANFNRYTGPPLGVLAASTGLGIPSSGCLVFPFQSNGPLFDNFLPAPRDLPFGGEVPHQFLDAGPALNITGPAGSRQIPRNPDQGARTEYKVPGSIVGGGIPPLIPLTPEFLVPGSYTADNGSGGADVKGFKATLTIPSDHASWTGQDAIGNIDRSQGLTITWSGSGLVAIFGNSANPAVGAGAAFACVAGDADNGSFTVPAWVMSTLPASGLGTDIPAPVAFLMLATSLPPVRFQATGIDVGYFTWFAGQLKNVNFQ